MTAPNTLSGIPGYTDAYAAANAKAWADLVARSKWSVPVPGFDEVIRTIRDRVDPVMQHASEVRHGA